MEAKRVKEIAAKRATSAKKGHADATLPKPPSFGEPDDFVFVTDEGERARTLYYSLIERLLIESKLQLSSSGSRRSTYCFVTPTPPSA